MHRDHEYRENYQLKKLLIVTPILLVSTLGNVWRTVWRIPLLILWCGGLRHFWNFSSLKDHIKLDIEKINKFLF